MDYDLNIFAPQEDITNAPKLDAPDEVDFSKFQRLPDYGLNRGGRGGRGARGGRGGPG
jgi:hypothetical protein